MDKDCFDKEKELRLDRKDKSNAGQIDLAIKKLVNILNISKRYYTNSSCAGRIVLVKTGKKLPKNVIWVTHSRINLQELKKAIQRIKNKELIYFKLEPCILIVTCKNIESASILVRKAKEAGWKKSGILLGKNIICELISTERIEMPIYNKKLLVSESFLKLLIKEANKKLEKTHKKIKRLETGILKKNKI